MGGGGGGGGDVIDFRKGEGEQERKSERVRQGRGVVRTAGDGRRDGGSSRKGKRGRS